MKKNTGTKESVMPATDLSPEATSPSVPPTNLGMEPATNIKTERKTALVVGTYERHGHRPGWRGTEEVTRLFLEIRDALTGELLRDHVWLPDNKYWRKLKLKKGDKVEFRVRFALVEKGYTGDWVRAVLHGDLHVLDKPPRLERTLQQIDHRVVRKLSAAPDKRNKGDEANGITQPCPGTTETKQ
jgi:hypothetical protein